MASVLDAGPAMSWSGSVGVGVGSSDSRPSYSNTSISTKVIKKSAPNADVGLATKDS